MYTTDGKHQITDSQAAKIQQENQSTWDKFWSIPREKRTSDDWNELLKIQIMVKV